MVADATDGDDRDGVDGAKVDYVVTDDREGGLMGHGGRARLAEPCGTRDESPSSNLGRGKQEHAIRADRNGPTDQRHTP